MFRHFEMHAEHHGCGPRGRLGEWLRRREAHFGPPRGFGEGRGPGGERGFGRHGFGPGGGRERMFDGGTMRLVILQQLAEEPSYGYQLIKTLEERMAGGYRPSAGVIYPTLTMLEEQGLTIATTNEAGKKVYSVTDEGRAFLEENKDRLAQLKSLMNAAGRGFKRERSPHVMKAFFELGEAVRTKVGDAETPADRVKQIVQVLADAAKAIREL